jgi:hypothetical protein
MDAPSEEADLRRMLPGPGDLQELINNVIEEQEEKGQFDMEDATKLLDAIVEWIQA